MVLNPCVRCLCFIIMEDKNEACYTINKGVGRAVAGSQSQSAKSDYASRSTPSSNHHQHQHFAPQPAGGGGAATAEEGSLLYSVSQRVPTVSASYSSLCGAAQANAEWERTTSTDTKDTTSSDASEKHTTETNTNSSAPSSVLSGAMLPPLLDPGAPGGGAPSSSSAGGGVTLGPLVPTCVYMHSDIAIMMDVEDAPNASADHLMLAIVNSDEVGLSKPVALQAFALWMCSPLLELQLKPTHKPYDVRRAWRSLLAQYSDASYHKQVHDEPIISFQRNVFFAQHLEERIKDQKILELLYEEARYNILAGRYPCEVAHYVMLGGIQARIELGPYNPQVHSTHYFREEQCKYLPPHVRKSPTWAWLPISSKSSAEVRLLEQYKRIPISATNRKLMRKYLEFCWSLPFYGSAFFEGQVEQPVRGLMSLMTHQDIPVLVAINAKGVYVIDDIQCTVLVGLKYEEMSWDFARPSREDDPNCLPCLFIQFVVVENGARVSKILQVFSRQAALMDTLIAGFVHQLNEKSSSSSAGVCGDEPDRGSAAAAAAAAAASAAPYQMPAAADAVDGNQVQITLGNLQHSAGAGNLPSLANKLSRLTLATFDDEGRCIGQMGSWSFSY